MPGKSIKPNDFVALNREITALVDAGIPLESGLRKLASSGPGRLQELAEIINEAEERAQREGKGQTSPQPGE